MLVGKKIEGQTLLEIFIAGKVLVLRFKKIFVEIAGKM